MRVFSAACPAQRVRLVWISGRRRVAIVRTEEVRIAALAGQLIIFVRTACNSEVQAELMSDASCEGYGTSDQGGDVCLSNRANGCT